jgi:hypothetical protein
MKAHIVNQNTLVGGSILPFAMLVPLLAGQDTIKLSAGAAQ